MLLLLLSLFLPVLVFSGQQEVDIRTKTTRLFAEGDLEQLLAYLQVVESNYDGLDLNDGVVPTLYAYQGVALYNAKRMNEAATAFRAAVNVSAIDTRSWINLGEVEQTRFNADEAIFAFEQAYEYGDGTAVQHLLRAKGWVNDWQNFEQLAATVERTVRSCIASGKEEVESGPGAVKDIVYDAKLCQHVDSSTGYEYTHLPGDLQKFGFIRTPNARSSEYTVSYMDRAHFWPRSAAGAMEVPLTDEVKVQATTDTKVVVTGSAADVTDGEEEGDEEEGEEDDMELSVPGFSSTSSSNRRLKVGIVSADFGVHPVATLARGLLDYLNPEKIELYAFSLQPKMSWWGRNISRSVEHFIYLDQVNTKDMAAYVAAFDIEVLIDLNGHTQFSGLRFMAHRPAPIQMSFLGLPTTTGAEFIDYYIGDAVALPPEHSSHFTESLLLVPGCYIVNDYAQLQGDIVDFIAPSNAAATSIVASSSTGKDILATRAPRSMIKSDVDLSVGKTPFLMATLSNNQKLDPSIFHVWANILRRFPNAKMLHMSHIGSISAMKHLRNELTYYGLHRDRFAMAEQAPWIEHLLMKTSIDLVLDSHVKNGHTTGLDGIFAGIPTMTFATGTTMSSRAGQSILSALGSELGLAYSMRDYEDCVHRLASSPAKKKEETEASETESQSESEPTDEESLVPAPYPNSTRLSAWREHVRSHRDVSPLYDTKKWTGNFERSMHGVWELAHLKNTLGKHYHIITSDGKGQQKVKEHETEVVKEKTKVSMYQVYTTESPYFDRKVGASRRGATAYFMDVDLETPTTALKHSVPQKSVQPVNKDDQMDPSEKKPTNMLSPKKEQQNVHGASADEHDTAVYSPLPADIFDGRYIFLNIGGFTPKPGWYNVNSQAKDLEIGKSEVSMDVDITRLMHELQGFPDKSVSAIYASHILEHASFGDSKLFESLQEWHRVLRPGGLLMISVPDLTTVFQMYLRPNITLEEKWLLTRVIYGAQTDEYDYHKVGFSEDILEYFLKNPFQGVKDEDKAGLGPYFCDIRRVNSFQLFPDSSEIEMQGHKISLNMAASRCILDSDEEAERSFKISMNSIPYEPKQQQFPHKELCESCSNSEAEAAAETEAEIEEEAEVKKRTHQKQKGLV